MSLLSRGSLLLPPASGRAAVLGLWAHYPSIPSTFPEPFHFVSVSPPLPPLLFFTRTSVIGLKAHLKPQKLTSGKGLYRGHYIEVLEMQASGNLSAEHTTSVELSSPVFQSTDWGGVLFECLRRSPLSCFCLGFMFGVRYVFITRRNHTDVTMALIPLSYCHSRRSE